MFGMTGYDRLAGGRRRTALVSALLWLPALGLLGGCADFKQIVGLDQTMPDEFAVETRAPLTIPPDFDLRPPKPGVPRPQEASAASKARQVIDSAGPGKPGDQTTMALQAPPGGLAGGEQPDATRQVQAGSLAGKLLGASDTASAGEKRETSTLQGVY
jgi:hypothetical protein